MSKKKKDFSLDEYDQATLQSFQDGFFQGMLQAHGIASATIQSLIVSIEDVASLYNEEDTALLVMQKALKKVMQDMDTNYIDGVRDIKVEFGLEDDDWGDLTIG